MTQASVLMLPQIGIETTPGTKVAASKKFGAVMIDPTIDVDIEEFSASGFKVNNLAIFNREMTTASLSGKPTFTEIIYLLNSLLGTGVIATPAGGTDSRTHTFTPNPDGADTPKTMTVEIVGPDRSYRFGYGLVNELTFTVSRTPGGSSIDLSGSMMGQEIEDGITPTSAGSVTALDLIPMVPNQFDLYIDNAAADLGTTQFTESFQVVWSYGLKYKGFYSLDSSAASWSSHYEIQTASRMEVRFERNATSSALLASMRAGDTKFLQLVGTGPEIESGENYLFQLDFAGKIVDASFGNDDDLATIVFPFTNVYDPTWDKSLIATVENGLTAL